MAEQLPINRLSIKEVGSGAPAPKGQGDPILPVEGKRNVLITSALPYVNNVPHLGNIIGCVLSADVFARWSRLKGYNTLFICGTDEYGTATETKAYEEGLTPKEICDKYNALHTQVYKWFNIAFDHFGRTSCEEQTAISQDIFLKLHQRGFLKEDSIEQLFCEHCQKFLADRFVEGECPLCGFPDARGDQCDGCQKLLNPTELIKPRCKQCKSTQIIVKSTTHQFLDLPKLQEQLKAYTETSRANGKWTNNSYSVTEAWVKNLLPRCITRDLKWGVPVPLEGYEGKVLYVWFDAPIGYISITADYTKDWEKWWKNSKNVDLIQFMGKDNIPFHTVLFPASLIGSGDPYTLLHSISTTEYLNYEGQKFSKSRKTGVFGDELQTIGIPADIWRFYLLMNRPETSDADFNWDDFAAKNNNELLANLGNFFNRSLKFVQSSFGGIIQKIDLNERDQQLIDKVNPLIAEYDTAFANFHIKEGLRIILAIGKLGNQYYQDEKPWEKVNTDKARAGSVVSLSANLTKLIAILLEPYLPEVAKTVLKQLNTTHEFLPTAFEITLQENHKIGEPEPIFKRIEDKDVKAFRARFQGTQEEKKKKEAAGGEKSFPAVFKVGKVLSVENHPTADTLYVLKVDVGEKNPRQVVAGLRSHYTPEQLQGREVVVLINLKPSKLRGVSSEAMLVVAEKKEGENVVLGLLKVNGEAAVGTPILPQGYSVPAKPKALDYKKDFLKLPLITDENSQVFFVTSDKVNVPVLAGDKTIIPDKTIAGGNLK